MEDVIVWPFAAEDLRPNAAGSADCFAKVYTSVPQLLVSQITGQVVLGQFHLGQVYLSGYGVYQDLRLGFRLAVVIGIWLMPTPMPPRTFGGYFPRAFSAAAFVLNGFEILSG